MKVLYPLTITWIPTRRCNLSCSYCKFRDNTAKELSEDKIHRIIDIFNKHLPDRFICILGGDVSVWKGKRLENFVEHLKNSHYGLQTNGVLISSDYLRILEKAGLKNLSLSLDPASCGDRFEKEYAAERLVHIAKSVGIEDVHVTLTLDRRNYSDVLDVVELIDVCGAWAEITPYIAGTTKHYDFGRYDMDLAFTKKDLFGLKIIMERLKIMKRSGVRIHTTEEYLDKFAENVCVMPKYKFRCSGMVNLVVDSDGSLRPCLHIRGDKIRKINILDFENVEKIHWNEIIQNQWFDDVQKQCRGCFWDCQAELNWIYNKNYKLGETAVMAKVNNWFNHGAK